MSGWFYRAREPYHLVLLWGVTTVLATALTQLEQMMALGLPGTAAGRVLVYWTVLMAPPVIGTVKEFQDLGDRYHLNMVWGVVVVVGMVLTWVTLFAGMEGQQALISYFHKWFFLPAVGFAYSAYKLNGSSRTIYGLAAVANLGLTAALVTMPGAIQWVYGAAVPLQGAPMLVDWYLHR